MQLRQLNRWDVSIADTRDVQRALAPEVIREGDPDGVELVAGIDTGLSGAFGRAAVVVEGFPGLTVLETSRAEIPLAFPYIPGYLSFREAPAIIVACEKLETRPELVIVDGQGIAHPRGMGIASHIGLILDLPTIGVAKSILIGRHGEVGPNPGDWSPLEYRGEIIGAAVRTKARVKPVFVSIGHRIGLEPAVRWVLACCRGYRLPEPQRQAHLAAGSAG